MSDVRLNNICKVYDSRERGRGGVLAVKNFSMDIRDGEFIVFVGPSGCGKSTTLRMIAGLEDISSGDLYIDGTYVNDVPAKDRNIAMVFQNYALYPHMTAYQNISFGLTLQKIQEPVYEENEEVKAVLAEIDALKNEFALIGKKNAAGEKKIDSIEKSNAAYSKSLDALTKKIAHLKNRGMHQNFVRTAVSKAEERVKSLNNAISEGLKQIERIIADMNESKMRMSEIKEVILGKQQSIAGYQLKRIDQKKIAELNKSLAYYRRLAVSDEAVRNKDEVELQRLEGELNLINKNGSLSEEQQFRAEGLQDLIRRYREELDILAQRKISIEQNISRNQGEIEHYSQTPVPVFKTRHYTKAEIDEKVMRAAEILDIKKLLRRKPREMSGGQRQRIALGRAIVREPKVFLLDEPLSNLDAKLRTSMRSEIVKLHKQLNTTFIYVTHDQVEAMTMGTRIVVMKDGEVQQIDTPVNLFDNPVNTFVAGFIGTPQMNMFGVDMQACGDKINFTFEDGLVLCFEKAKVRAIKDECLDGQTHRVVMGVRCENLFLTEKGKGFTCIASGIELLGSETNIYTSVEGVNVTLKLNYRPDVSVGDEIYVGMDESKLYLFDSVTTKTILK